MDVWMLDDEKVFQSWLVFLLSNCSLRGVGQTTLEEVWDNKLFRAWRCHAKTSKLLGMMDRRLTTLALEGRSHGQSLLDRDRCHQGLLWDRHLDRHPT